MLPDEQPWFILGLYWEGSRTLRVDCSNPSYQSVASCAAILCSPTWHRRKRKHRATARLRLRLGTSTWLDRQRLLLHHATPSSQAAGLMAWRNTAGKHAGSKGDAGPSKGSGRWQYWQGSWSPSQYSKGAPWKKNQGKGQEGKASLSFPGYDVARKEEQHISEVATVKERDGDSYATALQRAINQVRKAEARTRKAMADKKSRLVQWNNWVTELKKTYAKERGRYQTAVTRLEREMEEALVEQECARSSLRKVAASMEVDAGPSVPETMDAGAEFEAIMQDGSGLEDHQESNEDLLQRTLQQADVRRAAAGTGTSRPEVVTTPPLRQAKPTAWKSARRCRRVAHSSRGTRCRRGQGRPLHRLDRPKLARTRTWFLRLPPHGGRVQQQVFEGDCLLRMAMAGMAVLPRLVRIWPPQRAMCSCMLLLLLQMSPSTISCTTTRRRKRHRSRTWRLGTTVTMVFKTFRPWSDQGTTLQDFPSWRSGAAALLCLLWVNGTAFFLGEAPPTFKACEIGEAG